MINFVDSNPDVIMEGCRYVFVDENGTRSVVGSRNAAANASRAGQETSQSQQGPLCRRRSRRGAAPFPKETVRFLH